MIKFTKRVQFLGIEEKQMQDGSTLYGVSLFDPEGEAIKVNLQSTNEAVDQFKGASFGDALDVTFSLRQRDNLYRLGVV